ncbi:MAG: histidine kinase [Clostridia bacterium]|nr:histidine kinase [Clostridia bacterium]
MLKNFDKFRLNYTTKLMLSNLLLLALPVFVLFSYLYSNSVKAIEIQQSSSLMNEVITAKAQIEKELSSLEEKAYEICSNPILVNYFNNLKISDFESIQTAKTYINPLIAWTSTWEAGKLKFRFFTNNIKIPESDNIYHFQDYTSTIWFKEMVASSLINPKYVILDNSRKLKFMQAPDNADIKYTISIFMPFPSNISESANTYIELYFKPEALFDSAAAKAVFQKGMFLVLTNDEKILYSTKKNMESLLKDAKKSLKRTNYSNNYFYHEKTHYNIYSAEIPKLNCIIAGIIPQSELMKDVRRTKTIFIFEFSLGIILLIFFSFYISSALTKKVKKLVKIMRLVQKGDLNQKIELKGNDEFTELGNDFNIMISKIRQLINEVYKAEILQKEAIYKSLQSQINPHFLYNTLETIKMMAEINKNRDISDALTCLGMMLRYNLKTEEHFVPLKNELDQIQYYCALENLMLNNRLSLNISCPESLYSKIIIKLVIQPLVENAIIHGFDNYSGPCIIDLIIKESSNTLVIIIKNNGIPIHKEKAIQLMDWISGKIPPKDMPVKGFGVGLRNVHERIVNKYGSSYGIISINNQEDYTCFTLYLPLIDVI